MSHRGLHGLRALHTEIDPILESLTAEEWTAPSACSGWRVQDVVAHLAATMKLFVDPDPPSGVTPTGAEHAAELAVAPRKGWTAAEVLAEFHRYRDGFFGFLSAAQDEPLASNVIDLGDLGAHPMAMFSDVFCFDHYCHVVFDICAPHGPVERTPPTPVDDVLRPAADWMFAGLPAMCASALAAAGLDRVLNVVLTGPGAGEWQLSPVADDGSTTVTTGTSTDAGATVTSSAHNFVSWGTKRSDWRASATVVGDAAWAAPILDAINII
jgi:uncharacterized protein (TIGR03083 family)